MASVTVRQPRPKDRGQPVAKVGRALRARARIMARSLTPEERHARTPWATGSGNDIVSSDGTWLLRCNVELKDATIPLILKAVNGYAQMVEAFKLLAGKECSDEIRIAAAKCGLKAAGEGE